MSRALRPLACLFALTACIPDDPRASSTLTVGARDAGEAATAPLDPNAPPDSKALLAAVDAMKTRLKD